MYRSKNSDINYCLTGAIIGDIAASRLEYYNPERADPSGIHLFSRQCDFTDGTILNLATKMAIDSKYEISFTMAYSMLTRIYADMEFGDLFKRWAFSGDKEPYHSWGSGAPMRIAYIGDCAKSLKEARKLAKRSAICTHDSPEALEATDIFVQCVWMLRHAYDRADVIRFAKKKYKMSKTYEDFVEDDKAFVDARNNVTLALRCFEKGKTYMDCMRAMFSVRCDRSSVGTMVGALTGAYYKSFPPYALRKMLWTVPRQLLVIWDKRPEELVDIELGLRQPIYPPVRKSKGE